MEHRYAQLYLSKENHLTKNALHAPELELLRGEPYIREKMETETKREVQFYISPLSFFQVNINVAETMFNAIARAACSGGTVQRPFILLDVCCGTGTISTFVAQRPECIQAFCIDSCADAIEDAKRNFKLNACLRGKTTLIAGKVEECLDEIRSFAYSAKGAALQPRIVAVIDPPRLGIDYRVCAALRAMALVDRVVYISCNPLGKRLRRDYVLKDATLAHSIDALCSPNGNEAPYCVPAAFTWPHTPHVELMTVNRA